MMSHEFFETVTDAQGNSWWDPATGNEIGDNSDSCQRDDERRQILRSAAME
jgi:hypothetical protein